MDTHLPDGYVAPGFPIEYHDMRDSMRAASIMANDFVQWARQQVFFANTTIVVITDHFLMADNLAGVPLPYLKRDIYNAFINQVPPMPAQAGRRAYCAFDIAPTLLESIGARLPNGRFGLGTSLFGVQPTLLEQIPFNQLNHELVAFSNFYQKFYNP